MYYFRKYVLKNLNIIKIHVLSELYFHHRFKLAMTHCCKTCRLLQNPLKHQLRNRLSWRFFLACVTGSCDLCANRFTYEVAPVFVLLEYVTLKKMREIIGWQDGRGDGIFSPGKQLSIWVTCLILHCVLLLWRERKRRKSMKFLGQDFSITLWGSWKEESQLFVLLGCKSVI